MAALGKKGVHLNMQEKPSTLPVPEDDGAANHLNGALWPDISFSSTNHELINLKERIGITVVYIYPMTGRPDIPAPDGWEGIPGAKGCTPQSCGFRDHYSELKALNAQIYGFSSQTTEYQSEAKERLHLPFSLLSDDSFLLKEHLNLPTFKAAGKELYKRITFILIGGKIQKVFYPVFPPEGNADNVIAWLRENA